MSIFQSIAIRLQSTAASVAGFILVAAAKVRSRFGLVLWATTLAIVIVISVFTLNRFFPTHLAHFTGAGGAIHVSSPSVYTRERLVNDRNDQDYWLREQLKNLDAFDESYASLVETRRLARFGSVGSEPNKQDVHSPSQRGLPQVPFPLIFAMKSQARDQMRQNIIENLLDDRHDLTGNSVYGLKFDTSIWSGVLNGSKAWVRLVIRPTELERLPIDPVGEEGSPIPFHVREYYKSSIADILNNPIDSNYTAYSLYKRWLHNVQSRMSSHIRQVGTAGCGGAGGWEKIVLESVGVVFSIDDPTFVKASDIYNISDAQQAQAVLQSKVTPGTLVNLTEPWSNILSVNAFGDLNNCNRTPKLLVEAQIDHLTVSEKPEMPGHGHIDVIEGKQPLNIFYQNPDALLSTVVSPYYPKYRMIGAIVEYGMRNDDVGRQCLDEPKGTICEGYTLPIPSGYFNFVERILQSDMYAYALFPPAQSSLRLVVGSEELGADISVAVSNQDRLLRLGLDRTTAASDLEHSILGFIDPRRASAIEFGWVLDAGGAGRQQQSSQLALVSVPAWAASLEIGVRTGWISVFGEEIQTDEYDYSVPIPPDYEALDVMVGGVHAERSPQINNSLLGTLEITTCPGARLLIPGRRLWRSAAVTIGAYRAQKIEVLPNMGGIIAIFDDLKAIPVGDAELRVWTSEGVDTAKGRVNVKAPGTAGCESDLTKLEDSAGRKSQKAERIAEVPLLDN